LNFSIHNTWVYIPENKMEDFKFMTTGQYGSNGMLNNNIGHIRLSQFTSSTYKEVKDALTDLKNNHQPSWKT